MWSKNCEICGKPLSDPISVELGIGPVCRIKQKKMEAESRQQNLFAGRADYEYGMMDGVLYIKDRGGMKSVTNDMENVLKDILDDIGSTLLDYRIMYRDSNKIWDGVRISKITEAGTIRCQFYSLNERDMDKAFDKLMKTDRSLVFFASTEINQQ